MSKQQPAQRRRFLKTASAGAVGAAAMAAPMVSVAQTTSLRFQSTWPTKDIFHEYANDFAKKVNDMAGGQAEDRGAAGRCGGAGVPGARRGRTRARSTAAHGVLVYHYGKNTALALWGSGPSYGIDANMLLAWHNYGGGKELLEEVYKSINMDVVSFLYGPMPTQPLGWFKKPIAKLEDMKGSSSAPSASPSTSSPTMGAAVNPLPGGEIVPALDRGLIDGAEFNNASSDRLLGFPDVVEGLHAAEHAPAERAVRNPVQ